MKKMKMFTMALAAVIMFASCSKENATTKPGNNEPGDKAKLTIAVTGKGNLQSDTKALGSPDVDGDDVKVNNFIAFIFRDGGALDCEPQHSGTDAKLEFKNATTAAATVYVVANTGALAGGIFAGVANEDQLKAVVGDLQAADQTKNNVWMAGQGGISFEKNSTTADVTVALGFVTAKIVLNVVDNREKKTGGAISINEDAVALLFAGKKGHFFGEAKDKVTQDKFYSGFAATSTDENTVWTALNDNLGSQFVKGENKNVAHYYTFGNNGLKKPTILTIKSTKTTKDKPDGTVLKTEIVYHPVNFSTADAKETIVPGNVYNVTITINGTVDTGGGDGVTDPEEEVIPANVNISVTPAKWLPKIDINKDFN